MENEYQLGIEDGFYTLIEHSENDFSLIENEFNWTNGLLIIRGTLKDLSEETGLKIFLNPGFYKAIKILS